MVRKYPFLILPEGKYLPKTCILFYSSRESHIKPKTPSGLVYY